MDDSQQTNNSNPQQKEIKREDFQQTYKDGGKFKDQLEEIAGSYGVRRGGGAETEPIGRVEKPVEAVEEIPTNPETEKKPELSGYVEKEERETGAIKTIVDDYTQQILLKPSDPASVKVKIPMTADEIESGLHQKVWKSVKWMAEWCKRQILMLGSKAEYPTEEKVPVKE